MTKQKRLDRPDRDTLINMLCLKDITVYCETKDIWKELRGQMGDDDAKDLADQIIALIPDIKEAKGLNRPELRRQFARTLHKALRQFEVEGCPEAFDMKIHIDQLLKSYPTIEEAKREERERITGRLEEIDEVASDHNDFVIRVCELIVELRQALKQKYGVKK